MSCSAGAATFSQSQAGAIANGNVITVGGAQYSVSAFNGTTGCTLSGAPTFGASAFTITGVISDARVVDNIVRDATANAWAVVFCTGGAGSFSNTTVARNRAVSPAVPELLVLGGATVVNGEAPVKTFSGGVVTPGNVLEGDRLVVTATGNVTLNKPSHVAVNTRFTYVIVQDATGGRTVTFDGNHEKSWSDTGNTANKQSSIDFYWDGTSLVQVGAQSPYV